MTRSPHQTTLFPYTTLFRSIYRPQKFGDIAFVNDLERPVFEKFVFLAQLKTWLLKQTEVSVALMSGSGSTIFAVLRSNVAGDLDRKSTRLNSSHRCISYAVF